jgi:aspartyl-tRNA synthetase
MILANAYRSHACDALTLKDVDQTVRLAGWVHRKRDHGNLLFVDIRDHYGVTQVVVRSDHAAFPLADAVRVESVIQVVGTVVARTPETVNPKIPTGDIEVVLDQITVLAEADTLPFPVNSDVDTSEELRLRHRYLDLRREGHHLRGRGGRGHCCHRR